MKKTTLLIIEDEADIRDMIRFSFSGQGFQLIDAENTTQAIQALSDNALPDLILLDWMLPGQSGIEFIQWIKRQKAFSHIPIIMLTAKAEEDSKVKGLSLGADDYVTKPFSPKELMTRIRAVLRRGVIATPNNEITYGQLVIHIDTHQVRVNQQLLDLTPIEYKLLYCFVKNPNKTYTREQVITRVWGVSADIDDRTVDVHLRRLRNKLKPHGYHECIKTVRGLGYQLNESP